VSTDDVRDAGTTETGTTDSVVHDPSGAPGASDATDPRRWREVAQDGRFEEAARYPDLYRELTGGLA